MMVVMYAIEIGVGTVRKPARRCRAYQTRACAAFVFPTPLLTVACAQSLAYVLDFGFTHTSLSWRLMLSVAAIPAVLQMFAMFHLPESPRWCAQSLSRGLRCCLSNSGRVIQACALWPPG
jgi:hypothetical protein